jgi:hypothetical protein
VVHARCGRAIPLEHIVSTRSDEAASSWVAFDAAGLPIALVERLPDQLRVLRGFRVPAV